MEALVSQHHKKLGETLTPGPITLVQLLGVSPRQRRYTAVSFGSLMLRGCEWSGRYYRGRGQGDGWTYVPGAGDDEESWSHGLTPAVFWAEPAHSQLLEARGADCVQLVRRLTASSSVVPSNSSSGVRPMRDPTGGCPCPTTCERRCQPTQV
jgi:hypothetical protein